MKVGDRVKLSINSDLHDSYPHEGTIVDYVRRANMYKVLFDNNSSRYVLESELVYAAPVIADPEADDQ